jgi:hypothetical protein
MVLVDKNINDKNNLDNKSVFSIGDYRHNLNYKYQVDLYSTGINKKPKQFFDWDDGIKFNPKSNKNKSIKND